MLISSILQHDVCRAVARGDAAKPAVGRSPERSAPHEVPAEEPTVGLFDPLIVAPITGVNALNKARASITATNENCESVGRTK